MHFFSSLRSSVRKVRSMLARPRPKYITPTLTTPTYFNRHPGATFLIFGTGPSLNIHREDIYRFIERVQPIVMGANNITDFIFPTYHAFTNRLRFFTFGHTLCSSNSKVLLSPYFPEWIVRSRYTGPYERLMYVDDNEKPFDIQDGIITTSCRGVSQMLIGIALVMGSTKIYAAGIDGYQTLLQEGRDLRYYHGDTDLGPNPEENDSYFLQTQRIQSGYLDQISEYMVRQNLEPFKIITPTVYRAHYQDIRDLL